MNDTSENPRFRLRAVLQELAEISADPADSRFQLLAAGPLEDLLAQHGEELLDEVETLARQRPEFRLLLNGVWMNGMRPVVVERLAKYRTNIW